MMYYHVYIEFLDEHNNRVGRLTCGYTKKQLMNSVTIPFSNNNPILFGGEIIERSKIKRIEIYESKERMSRKIILPDGTSLLEAGKNLSYALHCLHQAKVSGVSLCTPDFITNISTVNRRKATKTAGKKEKVFIVHGRTEAPALRLQKYLRDTLNIDAEIFDDIKQKHGSRTIIEVLNGIQKNAFYALIIVTPDDFGCLAQEIQDLHKNFVGKQEEKISTICDSLKCLKTRARQNVVFEFGLFLGALGQDNVCCLLNERIEENPSDIDGVLYVKFNKSIRETFPEVTEKLKQAMKRAGLIFKNS